MGTTRDKHAARAERGKLFLRMQSEINEVRGDLRKAEVEHDTALAEVAAKICSLTEERDGARQACDAALARATTLEAEIAAAKAVPAPESPAAEPVVGPTAAEPTA